MEAKKVSLLKSLLTETCPYCGKGKVFKPGKRLPFQAPQMYSHCASCGKYLEGEPGYFFGAMYISYGLGVGLGIGIFLFCRLILKMQSFNMIILIIGLVIIAT